MNPAGVVVGARQERAHVFFPRDVRRPSGIRCDRAVNRTYAGTGGFLVQPDEHHRSVPAPVTAVRTGRPNFAGGSRM